MYMNNIHIINIAIPALILCIDIKATIISVITDSTSNIECIAINAEANSVAGDKYLMPIIINKIIKYAIVYGNGIILAVDTVVLATVPFVVLLVVLVLLLTLT